MRWKGNYKAATLFEARPYCAGVNEDGYPHMKEVAEKEYRYFDFADLEREVPARVPTGSIGMQWSLPFKLIRRLVLPG